MFLESQTVEASGTRHMFTFIDFILELNKMLLQEVQDKDDEIQKTHRRQSSRNLTSHV